MNICSLIRIIQEKKKLQDHQIIENLTDAVIHNTEENELFKKLYVEAFGFNIIQELAEELVNEKANGGNFTLEETEAFRISIGADIAIYEFYLIMNIIYSEIHQTLQKHKIMDSRIYAELTVDILSNSDPDKIFSYFC